MLRISTPNSADRATILRLEGQIISPWTEELVATCERRLEEGCRLQLDLSEVSLIDRKALARLSRLAQRGVTIERCSPFHREQLNQAAAPIGECTKQIR